MESTRQSRMHSRRRRRRIATAVVATAVTAGVLLAAFDMWAKEQGATEVRLHVNAGNEDGIRFWDGAGFDVTEHAMRRSLAGQ